MPIATPHLHPRSVAPADMGMNVGVLPVCVRQGCWDDPATKTECNCKGDRGCRRLDVVLSQFGAVRPLLCCPHVQRGRVPWAVGYVPRARPCPWCPCVA